MRLLPGNQQATGNEAALIGDVGPCRPWLSALVGRSNRERMVSGFSSGHPRPDWATLRGWSSPGARARAGTRLIELGGGGGERSGGERMSWASSVGLATISLVAAARPRGGVERVERKAQGGRFAGGIRSRFNIGHSTAISHGFVQPEGGRKCARRKLLEEKLNVLAGLCVKRGPGTFQLPLCMAADRKGPAFFDSPRPHG